jgi:hypothetical protein
MQVIDPDRDAFIKYIDLDYRGSDIKLLPDAPPEAIEALKRYNERKAEMERRGWE